MGLCVKLKVKKIKFALISENLTVNRHEKFWKSAQPKHEILRYPTCILNFTLSSTVSTKHFHKTQPSIRSYVTLTGSKQLRS